MIPVLLALLLPVQEDPGTALLRAAEQGNAAAVRELVDGGAPVDAENRYGATPLFFAAERGRLDIVRILLEAGADPDRRDRFYQMTALSRALDAGRREVALLLVQRGAGEVGVALRAAVRTGDSELLDAVLANGAFFRDDLDAVRKGAAVAVRERLEGIEAPVREGFPAVDPAAVAGRYLRESEGGGVVVEAAGDGIEARFFATTGEGPGESRRLDPVGERSFAGDGIRFVFAGRGGMIERLLVERGGGTISYEPADELEGRSVARVNPEEERAASAMPAARAAPRPWPRFRGDQGSGIADGQGVPVRWSVETGTGIRWQADLPGLGVSSPIIHGDRVFVVTAVSVTGDDEFRIGLYGDVAPVENESEHEFALRALDLATGEPRWTTRLHRGVPGTRRHTKSSQANATPVTDGERIVTVLGSVGLLLAHDLDGNLLWERDVGVLNSGWFYDPAFAWGHASSPVMHGDTVILLADIHGDAFIGAFDLETGEPVWRTGRNEVSTFSTPLVHDAGGTPEVVVNGTVIAGYDAVTGEERWRLGPNSEIPIGAPLLGDGLLVVQAGYPPIRPIYAIRPGMTGDLSLPPGEDRSEAIAWSHDRGGVYIPSPLLYRGILYLNANNGRLAAYDVETGERIYRARIGGVGGSYAASPIAADGRLYFTSEEGETFVVRAGRQYALVARNSVDRIVMATPAASDGVLVVRAIDRLLGITGHE